PTRRAPELALVAIIGAVERIAVGAEAEEEDVAVAGADQLAGPEIDGALHRPEQHDLAALGRDHQIMELLVAGPAELLLPVDRAAGGQRRDVQIGPAGAGQGPAEADRLLESSGDDDVAALVDIDAEPVVIAGSADLAREHVGAGVAVEPQHERVAHTLLDEHAV